MSDVGIVAFGAISALGEGAAAVGAGRVGEPAALAITRDEELAVAGLSRPFAARAPVPEGVTDRARWLFERALLGCAAELDRVRPSWRGERVGLVVGTSSGGMRQAERAFDRLARGEAPESLEPATYAGPVAGAARVLGREVDPVLVVLAACASSAIAVGLGCRLLERGACDVVLAGGFDEVTVFVAAGFEALRATTASPPPRPFRVGRDGMALGEGAALLALARAPSSARAFVAGFGVACDAVHLTAPDVRGRGIERALRAAMEEAAWPRIDLVSPHATATPFNDPVEARVLASALGAGESPVVHPLKAQIGHTLGAAGALEALACVDALERGVLPAAAGEGPIDPLHDVRLLDRAEAGTPRAALKLASAFGGANAALVLTTAPGRPKAVRPAFMGPAVILQREVSLEELAELTGARPERLARLDGLARLALAAVGALGRRAGRLGGAGVVVGSALATLETNALFAARIRERGARMAEPRLFPYTSPNAAAGECSILFGLDGPSFSVGGGELAGLEALAAAALLVEAGDAEAVVVVAVDEGGPVARALAVEGAPTGAVAALVSSSPTKAVARVGTLRLARGGLVAHAHAPGHLALAPLASRPGPGVLVSSAPPDAEGEIVLEPL